MMSDLQNESITYNDNLAPYDSGQDETYSGQEQEQEMDKPVMIRTGRKVIGTGQMLQSNDRIGIRVLGILNNAGR